MESEREERERTSRTWMPLSSVSFHVLPTEKEPLVFSFDLCMKPVLSVAPGEKVSRGGMEEGSTDGRGGCSVASFPGLRPRPPRS